MIYYDGKIYRNLEEQVLKNQKDIEIYSAGGNFDLKGIVDGFDDLPESPTKGDYYLVGTEAPYFLYLYYNNSWVNLGEYPKEGPQGPEGIPGENGATGPQGPQGPKGDSLVYEILDIVPTTDDLPDPNSVDYWDAYLVGSAIPYMAYFVINGVWTPVGYITPQNGEKVVIADSANTSSNKLMLSAQSGTRKIVESEWSIAETLADQPNQIPSSPAVIDYLQGQLADTIVNTATGSNSFAISKNADATATGTGTLVVGAVQASGNNSVYIGDTNVTPTGSSQVCIGHNYNVGSGSYITAIGHCDATAIRATAIGYNSRATADSAIAIGSGTSDNSTKPTASGQYSIAIGTGSQANDYEAIAIGHNSNAFYGDAIAIGNNAKSYLGAITIGNSIDNSSFSNNNNVAIGNSITISAKYGVAIGSGLTKTIDHDYAVIFNRVKFIPMKKSDSYTLGSTMHGMTLTSTGVTYYAPSSTVTTGSSESALLICWYTG